MIMSIIFEPYHPLQKQIPEFQVLCSITESHTLMPKIRSTLTFV